MARSYPSWKVVAGAALASAVAAIACSDSSSPPTAAPTGTGGIDASSSASDAASDASSSPGDAGPTGTDPLATLSDDFKATTVSSDWVFFRGGFAGATIENEALRLKATNAALWFNASAGPMMYKLVTGDFVVTSRVHVRAEIPADSPVVNMVHLAGLGARSAASPPENHLFIVLGNDENDLSVETKTTTNAVSTYAGPTWPSGDAELRICRRGNVFRLYKRLIGGASFVEAASYTRADLPETLQVGPLLYANGDFIGLIAKYDEVTFATPATDADCTR